MAYPHGSTVVVERQTARALPWYTGKNQPTVSITATLPTRTEINFQAELTQMSLFFACRVFVGMHCVHG